MLVGKITEYPEASHDIQSGQHSRFRFRFSVSAVLVGTWGLPVLPCAGSAWPMRCCPGPQLTARLANTYSLVKAKGGAEQS